MSRKIKNIADAEAIVDALVKQLRDAADDFFSRSARDLVPAMILFERLIKTTGGSGVQLETAHTGQRNLSRPLHR
jgi:hypothetical protein